MFVCYALFDPRDASVRYVGMTNDLTERFVTHLRSREVNTQKNEWVIELRSLGLLPVCRTLQVVDTEREAREAERNWISAFLALDMPLFNTEKTGRR